MKWILNIEAFNEKATSKSQQRLFGMALAVKRGDKQLSDFPDGLRETLKKMCDDMSVKQLTDYAETKTSKLPENK